MLNVGKAWALESKGSKQIDAVSAVEQNHNLSAPLLQWIDSSILIYSVFYTWKSMHFGVPINCDTFWLWTLASY